MRGMIAIFSVSHFSWMAECVSVCVRFLGSYDPIFMAFIKEFITAIIWCVFGWVGASVRAFTPFIQAGGYSIKA